jgi:hypothetical protein
MTAQDHLLVKLVHFCVAAAVRAASNPNTRGRRRAPIHVETADFRLRYQADRLIPSASHGRPTRSLASRSRLLPPTRQPSSPSFATPQSEPPTLQDIAAPSPATRSREYPQLRVAETRFVPLSRQRQARSMPSLFGHAAPPASYRFAASLQRRSSGHRPKSASPDHPSKEASGRLRTPLGSAAGRRLVQKNYSASTALAGPRFRPSGSLRILMSHTPQWPSARTGQKTHRLRSSLLQTLAFG